MRIRIGSCEKRRVLYASKNTSGFYLSELDQDIHLLPVDFLAQTSQLISLKGANENAEYICPRRKHIPTMPSTIPFLPTETNKHLLEQWIRDHFKPSAFNTCTHQPLQLWQESHWTSTQGSLSLTIGRGEWINTWISYNWTGANNQSYNLVLKDGSHIQKNTTVRRTVDVPELNSFFPHLIMSASFRLKKGKQFWAHGTSTTAYRFSSCTRCLSIYTQIGPMQIYSCFPRISSVWRRIYPSVLWYYTGHCPKKKTVD